MSYKQPLGEPGGYAPFNVVCARVVSWGRRRDGSGRRRRRLGTLRVIAKGHEHTYFCAFCALEKQVHRTTVLANNAPFQTGPRTPRPRHYVSYLPDANGGHALHVWVWCLLFVLIRQGLRGGSGPQRWIRALGE